ncbi:60S ribosomal protein l13a-4-like, partial [Trifolium pratense]
IAMKYATLDQIWWAMVGWDSENAMNLVESHRCLLDSSNRFIWGGYIWWRFDGIVYNYKLTVDGKFDDVADILPVKKVVVLRLGCFVCGKYLLSLIQLNPTLLRWFWGDEKGGKIHATVRKFPAFLNPCESSSLEMVLVDEKTKRGEAALARLKVYEGNPPPYGKIKRVVVLDAFKVLRLQKRHEYCLLG